jgi:hypothetical protein
MNILPKAGEVVIPTRKFTCYALDSVNHTNKAMAFETALGYNAHNAHELIENIRRNITNFPAKYMGNNGYGEIYAVLMELTGANGKSAKVMTSWIEDGATGEMRLTSAYVKKR